MKCLRRNVEEALQNVLLIMKKASFEVNESVRVSVDEELPIMGYSMRDGAKKKSHLIVVSRRVEESDWLEGLLIHEMSHIYRTIKNHPSHNQEIIQSVANTFMEKYGLTRLYQQKILYAVMNHLQDIYADDIALKVLLESSIPMERLGRFFQSSIEGGPLKSNNFQRDKWNNASIMLDNAAAIGNMTRHGITDLGGKAEELNQKFLSQVSPEASRNFHYFEDLMVSLKEEVSGTAYKNLLNDYLESFLEVVDKI
jgi:hypothetical protein